jgi:hypothetical protein
MKRPAQVTKNTAKRNGKFDSGEVCRRDGMVFDNPGDLAAASATIAGCRPQAKASNILAAT